MKARRLYGTAEIGLQKRKRNKRRATGTPVRKRPAAKRKRRKCHTDTWRGPIGGERARRNDKYARRKVKKPTIRQYKLGACDERTRTDRRRKECHRYCLFCAFLVYAMKFMPKWAENESTTVVRIDERFTRANNRGEAEAEAEATAATATLEHYNSALGTGNTYRQT